MIKKYIIIYILVLSFYSINNNINCNDNSIKKKKNSYNIEENIKEEYGSIIIDKLNINRPLYDIDNKKNNIEENITILKESIMPDKDNSILFIAAHSGNSNISFFNELNKLETNDEVIIKYLNKKYIYIVKDIWEEKKNGYINVNKENKKQLILTTCSPNKDNYQLIINCIEKES